jgi:putative nucleotidyltransferase with HDIG domain
LERLKFDGHAHLFFQNKDAAKVKAYQRISALSSVDPARPVRERFAHVMDLSAEITKILYDHSFSEAILHKTKEVSDAMINCLREDPTCIQALSLLENHDQYTFYHSGRVCAYGLAVAMKMWTATDAELREFALGCLLHDIGKSKISLQIINKPGTLTTDEWSKMRQHPKWGVEVVGADNLTVISKEIILHHHERLDGKGYPDGLSKNEILEEVKIAAFVDIFDALTTNRPHSAHRNKFEALDFIRFNMLEFLSPDVYKAMVELLSSIKKVK